MTSSIISTALNHATMPIQRTYNLEWAESQMMIPTIDHLCIPQDSNPITVTPRDEEKVQESLLGYLSGASAYEKV